jgi:hypothetical protein
MAAEDLSSAPPNGAGRRKKAKPTCVSPKIILTTDDLQLTTDEVSHEG